jgi:tRNA-modifying protein YgfZ
MPAFISPVVVTLDSYAVLRLRGVGAVSFLQGQLSSDVQRLQAEGSQLAGLHNPQGRAIALLRLIRLADGDILALLPVELADDVLARLRRYVLRAKVTIENDSPSWLVEGSWADPAASAAAVVRFADGRCLWLRANEGAAPASASAAQWDLADIAAGLPQVYRANSEAFVGQMLNLDLVDAISFSKGCYTGQEVIARAHYRGRVKRRMQRFSTGPGESLSPGDSFRLADGRTLRIVRAAVTVAGGSEFLAVAPLERDQEPNAMEGSAPLLDATPLLLPYSLVDIAP